MEKQEAELFILTPLLVLKNAHPFRQILILTLK
jgi:hypothetical protein